MLRLEDTVVEKKPMKPRQSFSPAKDSAREDAFASQMHYGHPRMSRANRAKIFMPFDALKGLREALVEREQEAQDHIKDFHDLLHWS